VAPGTRRAGDGFTPLEMLADDMELRIGHQMVDVGDPAGDREFSIGIIASRARPFAHRGKGVLELGTGRVTISGKTRRQARSE